MDQNFLKSVGTAWSKSELPENYIDNKVTQDVVKDIKGFLVRQKPKSILVSGEHGVGKSTIINAVALDLQKDGWFIIQASAANIQAGQRYIGDLEQNIKMFISSMGRGKKTLWIVPRFQELYYAGRHEFTPVSILDHVLPYVENRDIKVIGEIHSTHLEKILQSRPQIVNAFEIKRVEPISRELTIDLAQQWIASDKHKALWKSFRKKDLEELYHLAAQYLSFRENPGNLLELIKHTKRSVESASELTKALSINSFIKSLSSITGLPASILDDNEKLDLGGVKSFFGERVIGQDEAVTTVVERIALIKAGLTDPSKPSAVFLFVGPTGTGKTEIAKALAEFLFGSKNRMVRLDMSEFKTPDSIYKIFGDTRDVAEGTALVNQIRKNPFSVLLLDEFEKAHPNIWDLFLQVFDDGRLTDARGNTVDFRHCIIIMTSNLGASQPKFGTIGFYKPETADSSAVMKMISQTFRPEFVNRIDRIVEFDPLSKSVAKSILRNELKKMLQRRGIRQKQWAVEIEDSAVEFLLEKGFSSTLGARPMKRAIEQYLLAPLALTIVDHQFPKGDQFLYVKESGGQLRVDFVNPDEPDVHWEEKEKKLNHQLQKAENLTLKQIVIDTKGEFAEVQILKKEREALLAKLTALDLGGTKAKIIRRMSDEAFWTDPQRFKTMSDVEFIDRLESAVENSRSLFERISDPEKQRLRYPSDLIKRLAEKMYLYKEAVDAFQSGLAQDAFLYIKAERDSTRLFGRISKMYLAWAEKRKMKIRTVLKNESGTDLEELFSVEGFGAYNILQFENGSHILEGVNQDKKPERYKVDVRVIPHVATDARKLVVPDVLSRFAGHTNNHIVRKMKDSPSPIVKDMKKGWRTGNIEKVLAGDFDLFE